MARAIRIFWGDRRVLPPYLLGHSQTCRTATPRSPYGRRRWFRPTVFRLSTERSAIELCAAGRDDRSCTGSSTLARSRAALTPRPGEFLVEAGGLEPPQRASKTRGLPISRCLNGASRRNRTSQSTKDTCFTGRRPSHWSSAGMVEPAGSAPATSCLQGRRSPG